MPSLIETRPFTIHPELFAWPSFKVYSSRMVWLYPVITAVIACLLVGGMRISIPLALLTSVGVTAAILGLNFTRYKTFLRKPQNQVLYRNCVVSLTDEEVRQDFTDGSFMAIKLFAVKSFRAVGDFYFIFASPRHGIVVPKTAFESPDESREFAERIQAVVRKK